MLRTSYQAYLIESSLNLKSKKKNQKLYRPSKSKNLRQLQKNHTVGTMNLPLLRVHDKTKCSNLLYPKQSNCLLKVKRRLLFHLKDKQLSLRKYLKNLRNYRVTTLLQRVKKVFTKTYTRNHLIVQKMCIVAE